MSQTILQSAPATLAMELRRINAHMEEVKDNPELWHEKGRLLEELGDIPGAIACLNTGLKLKPDHVDICYKLARLLDEHSTLTLAIRTYRHLLKIDPRHAEGGRRLTALCALEREAKDGCDKGLAFALRGDMDNAVAAYRAALAVHQGIPEAQANLGLALHTLRRNSEARIALEASLRLKPNNVEALNTLGNVLKDFGLYADAIHAYHLALKHKPDHVNAWYNLGQVLQKTGNFEGAIAAYEETLRIDPDHAMALAELLNRIHHGCIWDKENHLHARLLEVLRRTEQCANPFTVTLNAPADLQCENARRWSARFYGASAGYDPLRALPSVAVGREKLRIGYLSSDFHEHATAFLMSGMLEQHDRDRFEIFAYSCGDYPPGSARDRIVKAVDSFSELSMLDDAQAAGRIKDDGVDILIELKGYTQNQRLGIAARRPAPLQMHYLGYPGTIGARFIDYFIADSVTVPPGKDKWFTENLIRLPHSYQVNDRLRPLPAEALPRAAYGLPETGFIFAAFNSAYKILPDLYDIWMRLLSAVEGSVLWVCESKEKAIHNLRAEAERRGIAGARIIGAQEVTLAQHLPRYLHADLFLDTSPVCGHTTMSDALWCGVPAVTMTQDSFVGRVAASLLEAVGLPELITHDLPSYEALALTLARDPARREKLRRYLNEGRMRFALFDCEATTRALEAAYLHAARLHREGKAPMPFTLNPDLAVRP